MSATAWCWTVIEAPGIVERLDGHDAWVRVTEIQGGCGRCDEPGGCGGARIAHAFGRPNSVFKVVADQTLEPGQAVTLVADEGAALAAALAGYGIPTVLVLALVAVGTWLGGNAGALLGLLVAGLASVFFVSRIARGKVWMSRLHITIRTDRGCTLRS